MSGHESSERSQTVEAILQQIEALPTLSPVAMRVLECSSNDEADLQEIVALIESDPTLTARVLSMCRSARHGIRNEIPTVGRAVVMLGLEAIRSAMLSVEVFDVLSPPAEPPELTASAGSTLCDIPQGGPAFDRRGLWRHSLGVACTSELIAEAHPHMVRGFVPGQAFLCGLLHDLGKLALDRVLPKAYGRVAQLAERAQANIADVERKLLGLDHHTAGKRLAEHWGLPHAVMDVMWLHGQPATSLPDLDHTPLIRIVTVADVVARRLMIGWSGNFTHLQDFQSFCAGFGFDLEMLRSIEPRIHERVADRAELLGLGDEDNTELLLASIAQANRHLGRLNSTLEQRTRLSFAQKNILETINRFHRPEAARQSLNALFSDLIGSAEQLLGKGYFAVLWQHHASATCRLFCRSPEHSDLQMQSFPGPAHPADLGILAKDGPTGLQHASVLSWLHAALGQASRHRSLSIIPILHADGNVALLIHDRNLESRHLSSELLAPLRATWAASIMACIQHLGARRLSEQLAQVNRSLTDMQNEVVESRSMSRLGELAAGAAHEMNNPLTVISGQGQVLARRVTDPELQRSVRRITAASEKLSELVTSLHLFASPPLPDREKSSLINVIRTAIDRARARYRERYMLDRDDERDEIPIRMSVEESAKIAWIDTEQITMAVTELLINSLEAGAQDLIEVRVHVDPLESRLHITIADDGVGMSEQSRLHACDPFYSDKPAGRQPGLGLARARRVVDLHGGMIEFEPRPGGGTVAKIVIADWRLADRPREAA